MFGSFARRNARKLLTAVVAAAGFSLAGCNAPVLPGLTASADSTQPGVFALADPRGTTGPAKNDLEEAKEQFRERNFGLAASYDQLRRFDLADRAYGQVAKIAGESAVLHNNRGYSYLLRGEKAKARAEFARAQRLDPNNAFIRANADGLAGRG